MDWNKLPDMTVVVRVAPDLSYEATYSLMKDLFVLAAKHELSIITSSQVKARRMNHKFVTIEDYMAFVARYNKNPNKQWYRFGQAFYNEMVGPVLRGEGMTEHSHPDLFYCTDHKKAESIIFDTYIVSDGMSNEAG